MGGEYHNCIQDMANRAGYSGTQPTTDSAIMVQEPWLLGLCIVLNLELTRCSLNTSAFIVLIECTIKYSCLPLTYVLSQFQLQLQSHALQ